ncbi:MAG: FxsA family protein [Algiphilus sp.]
MPLVVFILWMVLEILLSARIADAIGGGGVLLWMLGSIALGIIIIRRTGFQVVQELQAALAREEIPARTLLNALFHFLAGVLLILPGPLSDSMALLLLIPQVRAPALRAADAGVRRARPHFHEPTIIEGEFVEVRRDRQIHRDDEGGF